MCKSTGTQLSQYLWLVFSVLFIQASSCAICSEGRAPAVLSRQLGQGHLASCISGGRTGARQSSGTQNELYMPDALYHLNSHNEPI